MEAHIAEVTDALQGLVATFGLGRLAIAGAVALVLLYLVVRKFGGRGGSAVPASRAVSGGGPVSGSIAVSDASPERDYAELEQSDISETERLRKVLAERDGWDVLPERLLRELSIRLRDKDDVLDFISAVEANRLLDGPLAQLNGGDIDADIRTVASRIAELADRQPEEAADMLRIVARIDPDNFIAVLTLAGDHFGAGRYQQALQLLERGIPICRDAVENPGALSPGSPVGPGEGLRQLLQKSMDMYEVCLEQETSA